MSLLNEYEVKRKTRRIIDVEVSLPNMNVSRSPNQSVFPICRKMSGNGILEFTEYDGGENFALKSVCSTSNRSVLRPW